ncbi:DNA ligase [Effusibacillus dendaii]|uniref:DNA ligase (ATP) n=1 Tax=Effusibacillus dendaii TaxID=2743772 RepID=A0A7I8DDL4_9BACL|nr:DNA ligase [Effusibacillus dendaii]
MKWDGVRILSYYDGREHRLFNRKLNERTFHYPELSEIREYCSAKSVILDGEIIALRDGKPSFYEVMRRDGITNLQNVDSIQQAVPVTYMIFDVLYLNGEWITSYPLSKRQQILDRIITPKSSVQLVENFDNAQALYQVVKQQEMEGVVLKDLTSTYEINGKDSRWRKIKFYRDLIAVVGGVTLRDRIVNSLLLGLFDSKGRFWYIGHAGTGKLTQKDWADVTEGIRPLIQPAMPFENKPPRLKDTLWLKPELTVKIHFAEWIDGHLLRQPSIQSFVDVAAGKCTFPVEELKTFKGRDP